jgi:hypothetical protein
MPAYLDDYSQFLNSNGSGHARRLHSSLSRLFRPADNVDLALD